MSIPYRTSFDHQYFGSPTRVAQSLCNDRCQNILYKAVFEHFIDIKDMAVLLLASKSFQNSSFGANFLVNFVVNQEAIDLVESVLSSSSCFSLQFVPSIHIYQWPTRSFCCSCNFVGELVKTKYFHLSLRSLTLDYVANEVLLSFFGSSTRNAWPQLRDLKLENCELKDSFLEKVVQSAPYLRTVDLSKNAEITHAGLEHVAKLPGITSLNLASWTDITNSSLEVIATLSNITTLNLFNCHSITSAGLAHLSNLSSITSLHLSNCYKIGDAGLAHLSKLSGITSLSLNSCYNVGDAGLAHLSKLSNITSFLLSCCDKITDAGLDHLSNLACITALGLSGCYKITDVGAAHLSKLSSVTDLNLSSCRMITDVGLEHLAKLSRMTKLDLVADDKITTDAKQKLKVALPNCDIIAGNLLSYF